MTQRMVQITGVPVGVQFDTKLPEIVNEGLYVSMEYIDPDSGLNQYKVTARRLVANSISPTSVVENEYMHAAWDTILGRLEGYFEDTEDGLENLLLFVPETLLRLAAFNVRLIYPSWFTMAGKLEKGKQAIFPPKP